MLTLGELRASPERISELGDCSVLIAAQGPDEVVVRPKKRKRATTMVFQHETIPIMRAERAEELERLRELVGGDSAVLPIRQAPGSFWDHVTVGRAASSDITLSDPAASNVHAHFAVEVDDHPVSVQDVGSSNGTFVNREQLQPHALTKLRSGDCIRFGQTVFYLVANSTLQSLMDR